MPFIFPPPNSYGKNVPEQSVPEKTAKLAAVPEGDLINTLVLAEFALYESVPEIKKCAERMLERADKIADPELRRITIFSLSKILNAPENLEKIKAEHLKKLSEFFTETAINAREGNRNEDALAAVQIALKCNPANVPARLIFSNLIAPEAALQTLHYGIKFLDLNSEIAPTYFNKYFAALADLQQDRIAAKQALALLNEKSLPSAVREVVANHAAMSLFWLGEYEKALEILLSEKIDESQQGLILKSRCLFEIGKRQEAIALLNENVSKFPPEKRDVLLSQLSHFFQNLNDVPAAIKIADRRVAENPTSPTPYLQRLYLFHKNGEKQNFDAELEQIFSAFPSSQTALTTLANFAAENGVPEIEQKCIKTDAEHQFQKGIFTTAYHEALVVENEAETAIRFYDEISKNFPKTFDGIESSVNVILAAAYLKIAAGTTDFSTKETLSRHAETLLAQYFEDKTLAPENFISAANLFARIGVPEAALEVSETALKAFPWHSQIRATAISNRMKLNLVSATTTRAPLEKEIRALAIMRRPNPAIWQEIAAWLSTQNSLSKNETAALKKIISPLAKNDLNFKNVKEF